MATVGGKKCSDDIVTLSQEKGLYLQPYSRIIIKVNIPEIKGVGKSISNWEIMEKLRTAIQPHQFSQLKVDSITREMVSFEGELLTRQATKLVLQTLNGKLLKLSGFTNAFSVHANEDKSSNYPTQHDWETFFADKDQNEIGERPDTVVVDNLPSLWFATNDSDKKPDQEVVAKVFEKFGSIRCVDIPMLDKYHKDDGNQFQTFSFNDQLNFKVYIQYEDYQGFCQAINQLKGMKLLHKLNSCSGQSKEALAKIRIDFDKTAYLSSKNLRKRRFEKKRLEQLEKEADEKARAELRRQEELERQRKEEKRKQEEEVKRQQLEEERRKKEELKKQLRLKNERKQARKDKRQKLANVRSQLQHELETRQRQAEDKLAKLHEDNKINAKNLISALLQRIAAVKHEEFRQHEEIDRKRKLLADEDRLRKRLIKKIKKQEARRKELKREMLCRQLDRSQIKSVVVTKPT